VCDKQKQVEVEQGGGCIVIICAGGRSNNKNAILKSISKIRQFEPSKNQGENNCAAHTPHQPNTNPQLGSSKHYHSTRNVGLKTGFLDIPEGAEAPCSREDLAMQTSARLLQVVKVLSVLTTMSTLTVSERTASARVTSSNTSSTLLLTRSLQIER